MLGCLVGTAIIGGSSFLVTDAMRKSANVNEKSVALVTNAIPFSDINHMKNLSSRMTVIDNKSRAGVLEILRKQQYVKEQVVIDSNYTIKTIGISKRTHWEPHFLANINLSFGNSNFVPPSDNSKILFDPTSDVFKFTAATPAALTNMLNNDYGANINLPASGKYAAKFSSFEKKKVYAFGTKHGNTYHANVMATDAQSVADEVYKKDKNEAEVEFGVGVMGIVTGCVVIGTAVSKP